MAMAGWMHWSWPQGCRTWVLHFQGAASRSVAEPKPWKRTFYSRCLALDIRRCVHF